MPTTNRQTSGRQQGPPKLSATSAGDLERLAVGILTLARAVPERTTIRQVLGLILVAYGDAMGQTINLKKIQEMSGTNAKGHPVIGQTIERTLDTFREPRRTNPEALGWVSAEEDPDDRRQKYLHLTPDGVAAIQEILGALKEGELE